jgi:hypothetical protein
VPVSLPPAGLQNDSDDETATLSALSEDKESLKRGRKAATHNGTKKPKLSEGKSANKKGKEKAREDVTDSDKSMLVDDC